MLKIHDSDLTLIWLLDFDETFSNGSWARYCVYLMNIMNIMNNEYVYESWDNHDSDATVFYLFRGDMDMSMIYTKIWQKILPLPFFWQLFFSKNWRGWMKFSQNTCFVVEWKKKYLFFRYLVKLGRKWVKVSFLLKGTFWKYLM